MIEEKSSTPPSNPDEAPIVGDTSPAETELHAQEIAFPGIKPAVSYKPYGQIIQLDWEPQKMSGLIHLPDKAPQALKLSFHKIRVIAAGHECKLVKDEDFVLLPAEAIMPAKWDGNVAYFSSENKILAIIK